MKDYYKAYIRAETSEEKFDIFIDWMIANDVKMIFRFWSDDYELYDVYDKQEFIEEFDEEIKRLLY